MCGIIASVGRSDTLEVLMGGLSMLDYRGYDSAGVALTNGADRVQVVKRAGKLDNLEAALDGGLHGSVGIAHTRWSTHGPPTDENAHPHTDPEGRVAVVHNGIIENYQRLRDELEAAGHEFASDTDTEVVPHLIADALDRGEPPEQAVRRAVDALEGSYAICVAVAGDDRLYGARNDSPLVLGIDDGAYYLASDVPAFRKHTDQVAFLEEGEFVTVSPDGYTVTDGAGERVEKTHHTVEWDPEEAGKAGYDHFMLKEIHEQPRSLRQCLQGRVDELSGSVELAELEGLDRPERIHLVAAGTSYHAAVYAATLLRSAGVPAQPFYAHEYASTTPPMDDALVVGVTQSGETADTLSALRAARRRGATTLACTNTVGSTAARECDHSLFIHAGPEIGVAATKTFASQLVALSLFSLWLDGGDAREEIGALRDLPGQVQTVLDDSTAREIAETYHGSDAYFFIGRGLNYPVALEGALKFKEITYEHAEGFAAGELKHGPLALVTENTPVFAVVTGDGELARKTVGNVKEVEARDAPVVAVTDGASDAARYADHVLEIPETGPRTAAVLANVQLQLVAYHAADLLGRPIDKPRNLAKSVTVE